MKWRPYSTVLLEAKGLQTYFLKITKIDKIANNKKKQKKNLPFLVILDGKLIIFFYLA